MRNDERLHQIERLTDLPLTLLAVAMVPLLLVPLLADVPSTYDQAFLAADWLIWAAFAADLGVKLVVAPKPFQYLRHHWIEALIVFVPFLRPLRLFRLLRLGRLAVTLGLNVHLMRSLARQRGTSFVLVAVIVTAVVGATLAFLAERGADGSNIHTMGDALWWALSTMTTVGYGDRYPVTPFGRGIAAALMLFGIAALSALTATVAAYIVRDHEDVQLADLLDEIRALREEVSRLQSSDNGARAPADGMTASLDTLL